MKFYSFLTVILVFAAFNVNSQQMYDTYDGKAPVYNNAPVQKNFQEQVYGPVYNNPTDESLSPGEGFESATFPPTGWTRILMSTNTTTQYWIRTSSTIQGVGAYGMSFGALTWNAFSAPAGTVQAIQTHNFAPTVSGEVLRFDMHYQAYTGAQIESLYVQSSTDGVNFTNVIAMVGDTNTANYNSPNSLVTVGGRGSSVIQDLGWIRKQYALPVGTIALRFVGYSGFGNNIQLDNIETLVPSFGAPYTGTLTINPSNPSSGTNFQTFKAAADSLNNRGVSGPVTFNVSPGIYGAGNRFYLLPVNGSSPTNRITFVKSGAGQVVIADTGTSSVNDFMVLLSGTDYVTFDGIDLRDVSTVANGQLNRGYYMSSYRGLDGSKGVIFKNMHIVLGGVLNPPGASIGIVGTGMNGGATWVAQQTASHDTIKIQNVRVNKSDRGLGFFSALMTGGVAPAFHRDIEISNCVLGDSISIGSRTAPNPIGIIPQGVKGLNCFNNRIDSLGNYITTNTVAVTGIALQITEGRAYNNVLRNLTVANLTSATPVLTGIQAGPTNGDNLYVYNNLMYNFSKGYTGTANATVGMQGINPTNFVTGANANTISHIYNNTIIFESVAPVPFTSAGISLFGAGLTVMLRNNNVINKISTTDPIAKAYSLADANATRGLYNGNYNNLFANGTNGFIGAYGTGLVNTASTLAAWKSGTLVDTNSVTGDVVHSSLVPLTVDAASANNWVLNGKGIALSQVTTDINGTTRFTAITQGTTDIGADEVTMTANPPNATESAAPTANGTSAYTQFGDTVCVIEWGTGGTLPTGLNVQHWTGILAPNSGNSHKLAKYISVTQTGGPLSGTTYNFTMKYGYNEAFNIPTPIAANLRLAKQDGTFWTAYTTSGTGNGQTEVVDSLRRATVRGLNSLSNFTGTSATAPLSTQAIAPILVSPANNAINVVPNSVTFVWRKSVEAVPLVNGGKNVEKDETILNYIFQLYTDTNSSPINVDSTLTDTTKTLTFIPQLDTLFWRVKARNQNGFGQFSPYFRFVTTFTVGITGNEGIPTEYMLYNNYPNPFNPATSIKYDLPEKGNVKLVVYNQLGELVATLVNETKDAGRYQVMWNAEGLSSGVYFYKIVTNDFTAVKKMLLIK